MAGMLRGADSDDVKTDADDLGAIFIGTRHGGAHQPDTALINPHQ